MAATAIPKMALALASTAMSVIDATNRGAAADRVGRFQAERHRQNAERARQIARQQAMDLRDQEARRRANLRARIAGKGVPLEGSPLAVISDLAADAELRALRGINEGEFQASRAEGDARLARFNGREGRRAAFSAAGQTLLTAASKEFKTS